MQADPPAGIDFHDQASSAGLDPASWSGGGGGSATGLDKQRLVSSIGMDNKQHCLFCRDPTCEVDGVVPSEAPWFVNVRGHVATLLAKRL